TAMHRQTGQPLWNVEVLEQNFRLGFPTDLPVMVFYNMTYKQEKNAQNVVMTKAVQSLLCLDARTGQVIHQSTKDGAGGFWYEIAVDPEQRTISIGTARETVRLRFASQ
ncbi:MAG TPA: hypothetical protein PK777_14950, partial [Thermoguttaceae bacterium]|nr:hypothetical protein [Thermoguttaceae bacterium]